MLVGFVVTGLLAYLVIVDLGSNAGKVHHGVSVEGYAVSGLTESDAYNRLQTRGEILEKTPITFAGEGLTFTFIPEELGWNFRIDSTTDRAMAVGREGIVSGLWARARSWTSGVDVEWAGRFKPRRKLRNALERLQTDAEDMSLSIDPNEMSRRIKEAIKDLPREDSYEIPFR